MVRHRGVDPNLSNSARHGHCGPPSSYSCAGLVPASSLFNRNWAWPICLRLPISPCVNDSAHRFGGFGVSPTVCISHRSEAPFNQTPKLPEGLGRAVADRATGVSYDVVDGWHVKKSLVSVSGRSALAGQVFPDLAFCGLVRNAANVIFQGGYLLGHQLADLFLWGGATVTVFHSDENAVTGQDAVVEPQAFRCPAPDGGVPRQA